MKRIFLLSLAILMAVCLLAGCGGDKAPTTADENTVVIEATDETFVYEGKTLKDYMAHLQAGGKLTFTEKGGMVTSIGGKSNAGGSYWMLYTSDTENANIDWGTFLHEGETLGSAAVGYGELPVKKGCVYIWAYQSF